MVETVRAASKKPAAFVRKEPFFCITLFLTFVCALISPPHPSAVKWNVVSLLFSLMLIALAFERCNLLSSFARFSLGVCKTPGRLGFAMLLTTGALSMCVTNDVALLTVVPLTLKMAKLSGRDPYRLVILETLAANLFSALTPVGNPQNLYLYSHYQMRPAAFFAAMGPFCLIGGAMLLLLARLLLRGEAYGVERQPFALRERRLLAVAAVLFGLNVLSVLRVLDYRIAFALTAAAFLLLAPGLFRKVDYTLLLTFVLFFLFTDSVTGMAAVRELMTGLLSSGTAVLLVSAGLSQVISNVPAAVLLSGFTEHARQLLFGVSAGGLGTLIASLASLISYKLYVREYRPGRYLKLFYLLNFSLLLVLLAAGLLGEAFLPAS